MTPTNEKVPQAGAYPKFLYHEATTCKSISTPSWMGCWPITGLPPTLKICRKFLLTSSNIYRWDAIGWKRRFAKNIKLLRTLHGLSTDQLFGCIYLTNHDLVATCQSWGLKMICGNIFFMNLRSLFCYWRSSFMKSWQKSLKFSISQLNQNDVATKLFNPSVVWQGSVVFGEVNFFSYFSFVPSIVLLLLFKSL